jgi:DUF4097 and DUF4098 domain-containing protein YvlB
MPNGTTYRRGSVFGALLLIAIGGLFLYANLNPEFSAWPVVAKYWPVLIIFWGLGKLVDYLMLRGTPDAAAATRITGGDIVGLIFLIILGTVFTRAVEHGWRSGPIVIGDEEIGCLFGNQYEFTEELQQELPPSTTLTLSNLRGDATITAAAGNQFHLLGTKTVCASSEAEARKRADRVVPVLEGSGEDYSFHWEAEAGVTDLVSVDLDVQVPQSTRLRLSGRRGDFRISGIQRDVRLELERGDAALNQIEGEVRVQIRRGSVNVADVRGSVEVEGRGDEVVIRDTTGAASLQGEFYGPIEFAKIAGPASFRSRRTNFSAARIDDQMTVDSGVLTLRGVPGDASLLTRDKEIEFEEVGGQIRIENRNGRVVVRTSKPPISPIEVENSRGSIELVLPNGSGFQISANARNGDIETNFEGLQVEEERGGDHSLTGTAGTPRTSIRLNTSHGTIYIRRSG